MKRQIMISVAVFGGLIVLITGLLIVPTIRDIRKLNLSILEERARLEARYAKRHTVRKAIEFVENIREELTSLRSIAVEEGTEIEVVSAIEELAGTAGVVHQIRLIPPTDLTKTGYDRRLGIEIDARGEPRSVGRFFEEIEHLPHATLDGVLSLARLAPDGSTVSAHWNGSVSWPEAK